MCVAVLCLYVAAMSLAAPAIRYADRYKSAVLEDEPALYLQFNHDFPFDSSLYPYPRIGYIKTELAEGEPNDATKIVKAGGIGNSILVDSSARDGGRGDGGAWALAVRNTLQEGESAYNSIGDKFSFAGDVYPASLSFEFWYKTLPAGQPQPENTAYFFNQIRSYLREPRAPGVAALRADENSPAYFRVLGGPKFWYTGVEAPYDETWNHIVVTYQEDEPNESMHMQFYLNGENLAIETVSQPNGGVELLQNINFSSPLTPWAVQGSGTLSRLSSGGPGGTPYARLTGRTSTTDGIKQDLMSLITAGTLVPGNSYEVGGIRARTNEASPYLQPIRLYIQQTDDSGTQTFDLYTAQVDEEWSIGFGVMGTPPIYSPATFNFNPDGTVTELFLCIDGPASGREIHIGIPPNAHLFTESAPLQQAMAFSGLPARMGPELISLVVGGMNDWGWLYSCFNGYIDEFAVYNGVLSTERIQAHYNAWQPQSCEEIWARGNPDEGFLHASGGGTPYWFVPSGENVGMLSDLNQDCYVDLVDFALLAIDWAKCTTPGGSGCETPWL